MRKKSKFYHHSSVDDIKDDSRIVDENKNINNNVNILQISNPRFHINFNDLRVNLTGRPKDREGEIQRRDKCTTVVFDNSSASDSDSGGEDLIDDSRHSNASQQTAKKDFKLDRAQRRNLELLQYLKRRARNLINRGKSEMRLSKFLGPNKRASSRIMHQFQECSLSPQKIVRSNPNLNAQNNSQNFKLYLESPVRRPKTTKITSDANSMKIVVIDDAPELRKTVENSVRKALLRVNETNYTILKGEDGVDLIKYVVDDQKENNRIACIFIDENMIFMNGSEAIRIIRDMERRSKIRPVFICKISGEDYYEENSPNGPNAILTKPCVESDILSVFKKCGIWKDSR